MLSFFLGYLLETCIDRYMAILNPQNGKIMAIEILSKHLILAHFSFLI
jgi:hypothetical protein